MDDLREFLRLDFGEVFAAVLQFLEGFHDGLSHAPVRFLRAANYGKLLTRGDAFVAILVVEPEADQRGGFFPGRLLLGFFGLFAHAVTVVLMVGVSSVFSSTATHTMSVNASF